MPRLEASIVLLLPLINDVIELCVLGDDAVVGDTSGGSNVAYHLAELPALLGMRRRQRVIIVFIVVTAIVVVMTLFARGSGLENHNFLNCPKIILSSQIHSTRCEYDSLYFFFEKN
jgi:hypothetical protein